MANIAQLINVLQALLLVDETRCIKTPTYHVFDLYRAHQGAQAVRFVSGAETISSGEESAEVCRHNYIDQQPFALRAVQCSASVKDGVLCVTLVNSHPTQVVELDLEVYQGKLDTVEAVTLAADEIHAHNTFEQLDRVRLGAPKTLQAEGAWVRGPLAAGSVTRLLAKLG